MAEEKLEPEVEDIIVKRYAQVTGRSEDEARAVLKLMKKKAPDRFSRIEKMLGVLSEYGDKLKDPLMVALLSPIISEAVKMPGKEEEESFAEDVKRAVKSIASYVAGLKALDMMMPEKSENEQKVPPEVATKIDGLEKRLKFLIKKWKEAEEAQKQSEIQAVLNEIGKLKQEIEELKKGGEKKEVTVEDIVKKIHEEEERAKNLLQNMGYKVDKGLTVEEIKRAAQEMGLKVVEGKVPVSELKKLKKKLVEEMKKKAKEAYEAGKEEARKEFDEKMFERQIQAFENVVEKAIDRIVGEFLGPLARAFLSRGGVMPTGEAGQVSGEAHETEPEGSGGSG